MAMSMTGFGRTEASEGGKQVTIEVKSVNHRFLEVNVKSPSRLFHLDDLVKKKIKKRFARGYFDAMVALSSDENSASTVSVNEALLQGYLSAAEMLAKKYSVNYPPSLSDLFQIKDLFNVTAGEVNMDDWNSVLDKALGMALDQVEKSRISEGVTTIADINSRFANISELMSRVNDWNSDTIKERFAKLKSRMAKLVEEAGVDETRLLQEAAIMADKGDVSEELDRVKSHLAQVGLLLASKSPVGRKLEFFLQEINRETNTIGSKTLSPESTAHVVEVKSELEKIREQAQNLE